MTVAVELNHLLLLVYTLEDMREIPYQFRNKVQMHLLDTGRLTCSFDTALKNSLYDERFRLCKVFENFFEALALGYFVELVDAALPDGGWIEVRLSEE